MAEKDSTFLMVNRRSGKALQATGLENGLVVEQSDITYADSQLWFVKETPAGTVILNKAAAKVLDVINGGTENGTWAQLWEDAAGESQVWKIAMASRGYKKITHLMSGKVLDIQDLSDENGAPAQLWEDVGGANQEWKLMEYPKTKKTTVEKKAKKDSTAKTSGGRKKTAKKKVPRKKAAKAEPAKLKDEESGS